MEKFVDLKNIVASGVFCAYHTRLWLWLLSVGNNRVYVVIF